MIRTKMLPLFWGFVFCCAVLSLVSSFAVEMLRKRELIVLLNLPFDAM